MDHTVVDITLLRHRAVCAATARSTPLVVLVAVVSSSAVDNLTGRKGRI